MNRTGKRREIDEELERIGKMRGLLQTLAMKEKTRINKF